MSDSQPLPNEPASRTTDGTLLDSRDVLASPNPTPTPSTSSTPTSQSQTNEPAAPAAPAPTPVPESYTFKAPDGGALDQTLVDAATPIFKELGLSQAQADKLVDLYTARVRTDTENAVKVIQDLGKEWEAKFEADPELGPHRDRIRVDVGRALDATLTPAEKTAFQTAMDQTMVGNNPDFIRTIWKLAQRAAPGTHVSGGGPSPLGQTAPGKSSRPSIAESMWPNLNKAS